MSALKLFGDYRLSRSEVIIVDNNSIDPLANHVIIKDFVNSIPATSLINVKNSGLTNARVAGINAAKFDWIIFFDDDNEPDENYLSAAEKVIKNFPLVGCWGPGKIAVEFTGKSPSKWVLSHVDVFQYRQNTTINFDNKQHWQDCYPFGTGLIIKREVLLEYTRKIKSRQYTLSDRKGNRMTSGGDIQMVFTAISMGYYAGVAPELSLKHLVKCDKAKTHQMLKLVYGTASAYVIAYNQVFSSNLIPVKLNRNSDILKKLYSLFRIHFSKSIHKHDFWLLVYQKLGEMNAHNLAGGFKKPGLLKIAERLIHA